MRFDRRVSVKAGTLKTYMRNNKHLKAQRDYWKLRALLLEDILRDGETAHYVAKARENVRATAKPVSSVYDTSRSYGDRVQQRNSRSVVRRSKPGSVGRVQVLPDTPKKARPNKLQQTFEATKALVKPRIRKRT